MLVVRRMFELARALKIPLYTCFIELQQAYDSIDCVLLRSVLARYGIIPQQPPIRRWLAGARVFERWQVLRVFRGGARAPPTARAHTTVIQYRLRSGDPGSCTTYECSRGHPGRPRAT